MDASSATGSNGGLFEEHFNPLSRVETLPPTYDETASSHGRSSSERFPSGAPPSFDEVASLNSLPLPMGAEDRFWLSKFGLSLTGNDPPVLEIIRSKERPSSGSFDLGPIHEAALRNDYALLQPLEQIGAWTHIDERSASQKKTALHCACQNGCLEFAKALIAGGADVQTQTLLRDTPLSLAAGSGNLELVQYLLGNGCELKTFDNSSVSPLCAALASKRQDMAMFLLSNGAGVYGWSLGSNTVLHHALRNGMVDMANILLDKGAHPGMANEKHIRPIHIAAAKGYSGIIRRLLALGAEVYPPNTGAEWFQPLHFAADAGHRDAVLILLEAKADVNAKTAWNNFGYSHPKCEGERWGSTPLHLAAMRGYIDIVWLLLKNGAGINERRWDMRTPLVVAAQCGFKDIAKFLLENKAKTDIVGMERRAAVHVAVERGDVEMLELLLDFKADVNAKMWRSWTPLHVAAERGQLECANLLVRRGVKINATGEDGETAVDIAEGEGFVELAEFLVRNGGKGGKSYKSFKLSVHYGWKSPEWSNTGVEFMNVIKIRPVLFNEPVGCVEHSQPVSVDVYKLNRALKEGGLLAILSSEDFP
ncbi:uncharacterized protein DFL_001506 [Arthrobotrys flagrans]|uniref:Uncharacterized protein n=1 Tax=Arthrobotrys flagrans TaxID=97331 RepID=A0A437A7T4_ARTFL|nr:hypothetical protein DFL_001506 [Arthrobotrys flagrans]